MDKRIGAQYYTIRDFCQSLEDFDKSCEKVSKIGYKTVQLSGIGDFKAEDIKKILDKYSLEAVCTHRPPQNYLENLDREIEFHKTIGCNILGIGCFPERDITIESIELFAEKYRPVANKLKEHTLTLAYHNHAFEFEKIDGKFIFDIIKEKMACDNFKLILDAYWLSFAGVNPSAFIRKHSEDIACIHLKDLKMTGSKPSFAPIGAGNLDWDDIMEACENSSAQYALVEQDICDGNPFDCLLESYNYLTKKGYK